VLERFQLRLFADSDRNFAELALSQLALAANQLELPLLNAKREPHKGCFLLHSLTIPVKAIDIPVSSGREVEFPIPLGILNAKKELEAGIFPQFVLSHWCV
jgi:hypothetical protein